MSTSTSAPGSAGQSPASQQVPGPAGPAGPPFNRRVHIVAEVLDRPEELDLLQQVCDAMSWPIREPVAGETTVTTDASWRLRVIEVRIRGVRETAVEQAVVTPDTLAQNAELSLHCRDATLVERVQRPQIEWRLRGRRRPLSRRISHRLKFWDPAANQHTSIRLEDARIKVVPDSDSACAKAAR